MTNESRTRQPAGMFGDIWKRLRAVERRLALAPNQRPVSGTTEQRDSVWGTPATVEEQVALANLTPLWWNTDLGWQESYYATDGATGLAAPGLVDHANVPPGWYPTGKGPRAILYGVGTQSQSSGSNYTNWREWGAGEVAEESWKNAPGNADDGSSIFYDGALGGAGLQTFMAGRYRSSVTMHYQGGTGTGVFSFRVVPALGAPAERILQFPVELLASYGQNTYHEQPDVAIGRGGYAYFKTDTGSLGIGTVDSQLSLEYLGPLIVSR